MGEKTSWFVDWITVSQDHAEGGLPEVDAGAVWAADEDGVIEWRTVRAVQHEGSWETSVAVRCDGHRVSVSGNVGRFGRADNVFGYGLREVLVRCNKILEHYGLPSFTAGQRCERLRRDGSVGYGWTGARISRLDMTANFAAGSMAAAHGVMQYLGEQHAGRKSGRTLGQGETVDWGGIGNGKSGNRGSRRVYAKAYLKALELRKRGAPAELVEWCESVGLVRYELTLRSNSLNDVGAAWLGDYQRGWAMAQLIRLFDEHSAVLSRATRTTDDLDDLPRHLRATARDYLAGMDLRRTMTTATFYRHRSALLPYGLDISVRNVRPFKPRVEVVKLEPVAVPAWYQFERRVA